MTVKKFRVSFDGLPDMLLHDDNGTPMLRLKVFTRSGYRNLDIHAGEIVRTEDDLVKAQLEQYAPPRVPKLMVRAQGEPEASNQFYEHADHADLRPFEVVANNLTHHIEL